jgi:RNA recognition motif-containing protein
MDQTQESKTLWLGDLETFMDEPYITNMINGLGYSQHLASVKVIKDKATGTPAKYGFIEFTSHQIAEKFLNEYNGKLIPNIPNKHFKLKWGTFGGGVKPSNLNLTSAPGVIYYLISGKLRLCW